MDRSPWMHASLAVALIALDQGVKYFWQDSTKAFVNEQGPFALPFPPWLIVVASVVIITVLAHVLFKNNTPIVITRGLVFLLAGGAGNLIDRLLYGYVQDIIAVLSVRFNLADIYIFVGATLLIMGVYEVEKGVVTER